MQPLGKRAIAEGRAVLGANDEVGQNAWRVLPSKVVRGRTSVFAKYASRRATRARRSKLAKGGGRFAGGNGGGEIRGSRRKGIGAGDRRASVQTSHPSRGAHRRRQLCVAESGLFNRKLQEAQEAAGGKVFSLAADSLPPITKIKPGRPNSKDGERAMRALSKLSCSCGGKMAPMQVRARRRVEINNTADLLAELANSSNRTPGPGVRQSKVTLRKPKAQVSTPVK